MVEQAIPPAEEQPQGLRRVANEGLAPAIRIPPQEQHPRGQHQVAPEGNIVRHELREVRVSPWTLNAFLVLLVGILLFLALRRFSL